MSIAIGCGCNSCGWDGVEATMCSTGCPSRCMLDDGRCRKQMYALTMDSVDTTMMYD